MGQFFLPIYSGFSLESFVKLPSKNLFSDMATVKKNRTKCSQKRCRQNRSIEVWNWANSFTNILRIYRKNIKSREHFIHSFIINSFFEKRFFIICRIQTCFSLVLNPLMVLISSTFHCCVSFQRAALSSEIESAVYSKQP